MPFIAPIPTTPQAVDRPSFVPPPLDGSCTVVEAYDWHLVHSPEHEFYKYKDADGIRTVTCKEAALAVYRATDLVMRHAAEKPCFAILAVADTITYSTLTMGLVRAGFVPFLPSPRVSPEVLAQLLDKAGVTHVFHSRDAATTKLAEAGTAHRAVRLLPLPTFADLFEGTLAPPPPPVKPHMYDAAAIIHSSGSTSTPKILPVSFCTLFLFGISPWCNDIDCGSLTTNYAVVPMYHLFGLTHIPLAAYTGTTIAVFPPVSPPVLPHAETFLNSVVALDCGIAMCFPSILEQISHNSEDINKLVPCKSVGLGGAALKQAVGDRLVEAGVQLIQVYGMSECGVTTPIFPKSLGKDWQWMRMCDWVKASYRDLGDGTHEPVMLSHDGHHIDSPNCEVDGHNAISTNDVVILHPSDPRLFKVVGRLDDQIVLSTGEKTNAIPLEGILRTDPRIAYAVMFGRTRPHNGVVIEPRPEHAFDPRDRKRLEEFRDSIWPTVVKMNEFAPSHSRLAREMILVVSPSKPFFINQTKFTAVRSVVIADYESEIDAVYDEFEQAAQPNFPPPPDWEEENALPFVRRLVATFVTEVKTDEQDLFDVGCDSLKAAQIQNNILSALRATGLSTDRLPADIVYKYPTIAGLAASVSAVAQLKQHVIDELDAKAEEIQAILTRYTKSFPQHNSTSKTKPAQDELAFLVTGTTGGLGTNLLAQLLGAPNVRKVYALNRRGPQGVPLLNRHKAAFLDRGVDPGLLESGRFVLLEGDTSREDLGIAPDIYDEMRHDLTHIIHNGKSIISAWPVNFNFAIQTFEPAVRGAKHLVDLALRSCLPTPPKFTFISSISVSRFSAPSLDVPAPEDYIMDVKRVIGFGYPESKWIVERMLHIASEQTPLRSVSIRVGQLAGGSNGCWNITDWVPAMIRSAKKLGCIPNADTSIAWMRLDEAAAAVIEMRDAAGVLHLVHPRPVPWRVALSTFSKTTGVPLVPWDDWMARLTSADSSEDVPALRILGFWRGLGTSGLAGMSAMEDIATGRAQEISPILRNMAPLSTADAAEWLSYWQRLGAIA
ncbi:acetyl-CoA synthetase-like protein [Auricularia subglabra TFB-10046 SS5]|nr:acetyl-CoA synthetase-like protein [Auricularia subglabra TFB-10046 SS5]